MWDFLRGTRILDLSRLLPGPYATLLLADLGAEVIKIEEPGAGDPLRLTPPFIGNWSAYFVALNRNKQSVVLDLKSPAGRDIFINLATHADAVLETFRPGVMERLGINYDSVRRLNPKIVYCSLTGYGQTGPYRERVGHDLNYVAVAGLLSLTGSEKPEIPGTPIADLSGGMAAALMILAALQRRERDGQGAYIDLSMTDVVFSWLAIHLAQLQATGAAPRPSEAFLLGAFPYYAIYETGDGEYVTVGALEPKFWKNLCVALGRTDHIPHQFNSELREEVFADMRAIFKTKHRQEWLEILGAREVPIAPVNDLADALADLQIAERRLVRLLDSGAGETMQVAFPAKFMGLNENSDQHPPRFGQHTREVLQSLGYEEEQIEELRRRGVIGF